MPVDALILIGRLWCVWYFFLCKILFQWHLLAVFYSISIWNKVTLQMPICSETIYFLRLEAEKSTINMPGVSPRSLCSHTPVLIGMTQRAGNSRSLLSHTLSAPRLLLRMESTWVQLWDGRPRSGASVTTNDRVAEVSSADPTYRAGCRCLVASENIYLLWFSQTVCPVPGMCGVAQRCKVEVRKSTWAQIY